jgi:2,6-dihydroxypyridine 3-monooxygenase
MPRVIIVGGSLGGLTAALVLRDIGCEVTVLERAAAPLVGQGAGIVLHPVTVRYLRERAALDLDAVSVAARRVRYLGARGETLHERPGRYRFSSYTALYRGLMAQLAPSAYRLGANVAGFEQDEAGARVHLAGGESFAGDLVVCADGVRSASRRRLLPDAAPAYAGYVAWRGTVPVRDLTPETLATLGEAITYHLMPHSHLLTYPIPVVDPATGLGEVHINWLWYRNVAAGAPLDNLLTDSAGAQRDVSVPAGMVQARHLAALRADGAALPPPLAALVLGTGQPFIQAIVDLEVPRMAFGRACLIGDAAFVARPHAAAGTAKAAADAWALAAALAEAGGDVPAALASWEPGQLAVGRGVLERTRAAGDRMQLHDAWRPGDPLPFGLYRQGDSEI